MYIIHYQLKNTDDLIEIPVVGNLNIALSASSHILKTIKVKQVEVYCSNKKRIIAVLTLEALNSYEVLYA